MKKLSLELDDLAVESFSTSKVSTRTGTINAHDTNQASACGGTLCSWNACGSDPMMTCDDTTTMNDLVSACVTASMAGPTCEGVYGETCGQLCTTG